jgi:hypothetical protein
VAKKRKGARPTKKASRTVKKKAARKAAPRKVAAKQVTGFEVPGKVNFEPLKAQIAKHIAVLESATAPNDKIAKAISILKQARADLTNECLPTMELQTS